MGLSLAFHMVFAALGVGLPLVLVLADLAARRTGDAHYARLAQRMAKGTAVLFAVGAVSGTVLALELGLLWPEFMRRFGEVVGPLFALEGFAFFTEAIFLGIYLYGRERVSPRLHLAAGVIVAVSGAASAGFVTVVNAFMNLPVEVRWQGDGAFLDEPLRVFLAPFAPLQVVHVLLACYALTAFAMSAIHAGFLLRGREPEFHRRALGLALPLACATGLLLPISGDLSVRHLAERQPWKFAAMEAHYHSRARAPLHIGGIPDDEAQALRYGLEIPGGLSWLIGVEREHVVAGLDRVPREEWPPVARTHLAFQAMVACGSALALLSLATLLLRWRLRRYPEQRWYLKLLVASAPLALIAMEAGWMLTESGRQPFVVRGLQLTAAAATQVPHLGARLLAFSAIYVFLALAVAWLLRGLFLEREEAR